MPLNSSGPISMGGSTVGQSINLELGKSATAQISLNDTDARTLAGILSGQISLSDFYGKSFTGLYAWGVNNVGQLGLGDTTSRLIPVRVNIFSDVSNSSHTLALKATGTLWSWGLNGGGQLGLGDQNNRNIPVQVGSDTNWFKISAGANHSIALKTNGTLFSCGNNTNGQIGDNTNILRTSFVQEFTASNTWSKISAGNEFSFAIKADGTLWATGLNSCSQLGRGILFFGTSVSSYIQVGSDTNWTYVSSGNTHSLGLKSDGTIWTWGAFEFVDNDNKGPIVYQPTQVGSDSNWVKICAGRNISLAIKTDGTLWSWGNNDYGQLGLGDQVSRSSPTQIGSSTNWSEIIAGTDHVIGIRNNGTIWAWGRNTNGQLGLNDTSIRTSPTQIGTLTNWSKISAGSNSSFAILT